MRKKVQIPSLPDVTAPVEWAVTAGGALYTSQIPIRSDGTVETGPIERQAKQALDNLRDALKAAGGSLDDVTQVQIFLTRAEDFAVVNEVYRRYFRAPYPNRCTVVVAGLLVPGMAIELVAHAHLP